MRCRSSVPRQRVSIHAFRGEGDIIERLRFPVLRQFQSTPSGGKATCNMSLTTILQGVSIHAFRGEGDGRYGPVAQLCWRFQSTPSGGKATVGRRRHAAGNVFQSTPSGGKATFAEMLHQRADRSFNPRLPGGRRPGWGIGMTIATLFQSTPSGGKATAPVRRIASSFLGFNPRLPGGRRRVPKFRRRKRL